jgi:hypothetical protein
MQVQVRPSGFMKRRASLPICCTSSRVGAMMSAIGPSPCSTTLQHPARACPSFPAEYHQLMLGGTAGPSKVSSI